MLAKPICVEKVKCLHAGQGILMHIANRGQARVAEANESVDREAS